MIGLPRKTIFVDRNSGGRLFRGFVTEAKINVVLHDEYFTDPKTPDHVWLKEVGALGWPMVTGDIKVEKDPLFLDRLKRTVAHVFILCELNHGTPEERANCIIKAYPDIVQLCHSNHGPKLWKARSGEGFKPVDFRHNLGMLKKLGRYP